MKSLQVMIIRDDLKLPIGELTILIANASIKAVTRKFEKVEFFEGKAIGYELDLFLENEKDFALNCWLKDENTSKKSILIAKNEADLNRLFLLAEEKNLPFSRIYKKNKTLNIEELACVAIGPADPKEFKTIIKNLKVLK